METLFITKLFAIAALTMGIALALRPAEMKKGAEAMFKNKGITFLVGAFAIYFGAFIITYHNKWGNYWEIVISTLGYLTLLKGFLYIAFADDIKKMSHNTMKDAKSIRALGILVIFISLGFFYKALWCGCLG